MKSDARRFLVKGIIAAVGMTMLFISIMWMFDTVFNGVILDALSGMIARIECGELRLNGNALAIAGFITVLLLSILLSATGTLCAYSTYRKQHALVVSASMEAQRAKELAEREMQRKTDLITYLAHDLKTPLASIIGYLNLLEEAPDLPPAQRAKYVGITLDKAYRLEQLIDELFEIIRFNLQSISVNSERIDLSLMLEQLADEFYPILLPSGKRIAVTSEAGLIILGDSDKLARVFNNILRNAAAYSYDGTEIEVGARVVGEWVEVRFVNHGDPIPKQKLALIFEKFYRLDTSRSSRTGGAGLGLAIAKAIVDAHGGSISVKSDAAATIFTVLLPASPNAPAVTKTP